MCYWKLGLIYGLMDWSLQQALFPSYFKHWWSDEAYHVCFRSFIQDYKHIYFCTIRWIHYLCFKFSVRNLAPVNGKTKHKMKMILPISSRISWWNEETVLCYYSLCCWFIWMRHKRRNGYYSPILLSLFSCFCSTLKSCSIL